MKTFKHSGDLGDIMYSLPTVRKLGGGILYLNPGNPLEKRIPGIPTRLNLETIKMLKPLLEAQDYIKEVKVWDNKLPVDYDLDQFRVKYERKVGKNNLADVHLWTFGLKEKEKNKAWLSNIKPKYIADVVIHRSPRYNDYKFPWGDILIKYIGNISFVGLEGEWERFKQDNGNVPFYPVSNFLELAQVIKGSKLFIGNQSFPYSVAEGLKHQAILERFVSIPNCIFSRPNLKHEWSDKYDI